MPEAVQHFVSHRSYDEVRNIQKRILLDYEHDFTCPKISKVWNSIPIQISNNTYEGKRGKGFIAKLDEHTLSKQYICQQLMATEHVSIYCTDDTDFLIEKEDGIIPISAQKTL